MTALETILMTTVGILGGVIGFLFRWGIGIQGTIAEKCKKCEVDHGKNLETKALEYANKLMEVYERSEEAVRRYEEKADAVNKEYVTVLKGLGGINGTKVNGKN